MNSRRHYASQPTLHRMEKRPAVMRGTIVAVGSIICAKADNRWLDDANVREVG